MMIACLRLIGYLDTAETEVGIRSWNPKQVRAPDGTLLHVEILVPRRVSYSRLTPALESTFN